MPQIKNCICINSNDKDDDVSIETIKKLIKAIIRVKPILKSTLIKKYLTMNTFANNKLYYKLQKGRIPLKKSLAVQYPNLAAQWHPGRNHYDNPWSVTPGSSKKIWWQCTKNKNHIWSTSVYNRVIEKSGCPYCRGKAVSEDNCLAKRFPKLAREWDKLKNGKLGPFDVVPGSHKKVWWKCIKNKNHSWQATICNRVNGRRCPYCHGKIASLDNCLKTKNKKLAQEWHPTKNLPLTSEDVTAGSGKKVWWQCSKNKNHVWIARVNDRNRGTGCPYCNH